jgi:hypothetical protein
MEADSKTKSNGGDLTDDDSQRGLGGLPNPCTTYSMADADLKLLQRNARA